MPRLTRHPEALTTRKLAMPLLLPAPLPAGCATPGINHACIAAPRRPAIDDVLPASPAAGELVDVGPRSLLRMF